MKKGSLVVIRPCIILLSSQFAYIVRSGGSVRWFPQDDEKTIHTIKNVVVYNDGAVGYTFEEGFIGTLNTGEELSLGAEYVREVLPSISTAQLNSWIEDISHEMVHQSIYPD